MKIQRKYVSFRDLILLDPEAKKVIDYAYDTSHLLPDERERIYNNMASGEISVDNAEMGCAIPNFGYIKEQFNILDNTHPYDNQLTLEDVNRVDLVGYENGKLVICLLNEFDGFTRIVSFVTLSTKARGGLQLQKNDPMVSYDPFEKISNVFDHTEDW